MIASLRGTLIALAGSRVVIDVAGVGYAVALTERHGRELRVGDTVRPLGAGATTVFSADVPHAYEGAGRGPCELIMTVHLPVEHRAR